MKVYKTFQMIFKKSMLLLFLLCLIFYAFGEDRRKDWVGHAQSYIEADQLMALHGEEGKSTFLEDLKRRDEAVRWFRDSMPPTIQEIETLLSSEVSEDKVVACVAILITGNYSIPIVEKLISNLQNQMPYDLVKTYELKRYSTLALKRVHQEDLKPYEDAILEAVEQESNEPALIEEMLFLLKLTSSKSARVLTKLLIYRDSDSVKRVAYGLLHKLGPEYKQRALEEVKKQGDHKTLEIINKMDQPAP